MHGRPARISRVHFVKRMVTQLGLQARTVDLHHTLGHDQRSPPVFKANQTEP